MRGVLANIDWNGEPRGTMDEGMWVESLRGGGGGNGGEASWAKSQSFSPGYLAVESTRTCSL